MTLGDVVRSDGQAPAR